MILSFTNKSYSSRRFDAQKNICTASFHALIIIIIIGLLKTMFLSNKFKI